MYVGRRKGGRREEGRRGGKGGRREEGRKDGGEGGWQVFRTVGACETYLGQVSNVACEKSAVCCFAYVKVG